MRLAQFTCLTGDGENCHAPVQAVQGKSGKALTMGGPIVQFDKLLERIKAAGFNTVHCTCHLEPGAGELLRFESEKGA